MLHLMALAEAKPRTRRFFLPPHAWVTKRVRLARVLRRQIWHVSHDLRGAQLGTLVLRPNPSGRGSPPQRQKATFRNERLVLAGVHASTRERTANIRETLFVKPENP